MMTPLEFFTASGVLAWCWLVWRFIRYLQGIGRRLSWALSGWRRPHVARHYR